MSLFDALPYLLKDFRTTTTFKSSTGRSSPVPELNYSTRAFLFLIPFSTALFTTQHSFRIRPSPPLFLLQQPEMASVELEHIPGDLRFMKLAIEEAKSAMQRLEVPVGCVIVKDGEVIASGSNRTTETRNATRHAEMEAVDALLLQWQREGLSQCEVAKSFSNSVLYVTCEPCIMCAAALSFLGIKEVYYGCANDKFGGCGSIFSLHSSKSFDDSPTIGRGGKGFKCTGGIMAEEAVSLFRSFYEQGNPNAPKPHRPVLHQGP